jgi:hypothetical protein
MLLISELTGDVMVAITKTIRILSWGLALYLGLSYAAYAETAKERKTNEPAVPKEKSVQMQGGVHMIQGEVLRIKGQIYVIRDQDGKEVSLHGDTTTVKAGKIKEGDRIEAKVNDQNNALSIHALP